MWLGRRDEVAAIDRLLEAARGERTSATLIVRGDPGVAKTRLLEHVAARAADFTVLHVRPLEAETAVPFAGLSGLLRPILSLLGTIPEPQQAALCGALALGPPAPGDRFAVAAATLSVLAAAAEERPLLVLVDDAHWLDTPSREALLFAGRQLGSEGMCFCSACASATGCVRRASTRSRR
jgi:predicted ATPase